ncbi:hypothetical protein K439DRAFT_1615575 [Ramaria rubella]|nr:hypothetical protein K439DRAFT_1615575 [Ramaria rubella]
MCTRPALPVPASTFSTTCAPTDDHIPGSDARSPTHAPLSPHRGLRLCSQLSPHAPHSSTVFPRFSAPSLHLLLLHLPAAALIAVHSLDTSAGLGGGAPVSIGGACIGELFNPAKRATAILSNGACDVDKCDKLPSKGTSITGNGQYQ